MKKSIEILLKTLELLSSALYFVASLIVVTFAAIGIKSMMETEQTGDVVAMLRLIFIVVVTHLLVKFGTAIINGDQRTIINVEMPGGFRIETPEGTANIIPNEPDEIEEDSEEEWG